MISLRKVGVYAFFAQLNYPISVVYSQHFKTIEILITTIALKSILTQVGLHNWSSAMRTKSSCFHISPNKYI